MKQLPPQPPAGSNNSNGPNPGKVLWWLVGGILTPLLLGLVSTIQASVQKISALEATNDFLQQRLDRIERKIDQLLERR